MKIYKVELDRRPHYGETHTWIVLAANKRSALSLIPPNVGSLEVEEMSSTETKILSVEQAGE